MIPAVTVLVTLTPIEPAGGVTDTTCIGTVGSVAVNKALTYKFRCTLAKGTYKYYVYATDASGNAQSKIGYAKLTVK